MNEISWQEKNSLIENFSMFNFQWMKPLLQIFIIKAYSILEGFEFNKGKGF